MIDMGIQIHEEPLCWETELEAALDLVESILDDYYEHVTHNIATRLQERALDTISELVAETRTLDTLRSSLQHTQDAMLHWVRSHHDNHHNIEEPPHDGGQFRREWYDRIKPHLPTPMRNFLFPVLEILSQYAPMKRVDLLHAMEPLVRPLLNPRDQERLPKPQIVRWHNTVTHTLLWAEEHQLVTKVAPGYWEITPQGEAYRSDRYASGLRHPDPQRVVVDPVGQRPDRRVT